MLGLQARLQQSVEERHDAPSARQAETQVPVAASVQVAPDGQQVEPQRVCGGGQSCDDWPESEEELWLPEVAPEGFAPAGLLLAAICHAPRSPGWGPLNSPLAASTQGENG